eukprot:Hpha_TRINITY_DN13945_c0_g2::TRINITY_DN13945_c0_g2_i1::g.35529::m.35529
MMRGIAATLLLMLAIFIAGCQSLSVAGTAAARQQVLLCVAAFVSGCQVTDLQSSWYHSCVGLDDQGLICWGTNGAGQLGYDDTLRRGKSAGTMGANLPTVGIAFSQVSVAHIGTCGIKASNGAVVCWGDNSEGQLGVGDITNRGNTAGDMASLTEVPVPAGCTVHSVERHYEHVCLLCTDMTTIYCWGRNLGGVLGVGIFGETVNLGDTPGWEAGWTATDVGGAVTKLVPGGDSYHDCVLMSGGIKCWGSNTDGELGYGDTSKRGTSSGHMGTNLPLLKPGGKTITDACLGQDHTCVLYSTGGMECWGGNSFGQLGIDSTADKRAGTGAEIDLSNALGTDPIGTIACGEDHTCALSVDGMKLACWGHNAYGQLGYDDNVYRGNGAGAAMATVPAVSVAGGPPGAKVLNVACGEGFTCILIGSGVVCYGSALYGEIGSEAGTNLGRNTGDMAALTPIGLVHPVTGLSCSGNPSPSASPSSSPAVPSVSPSASPSTTPSASPSVSPSTTPSVSPVVPPTASPSTSPSVSPSSSPSKGPSISPSAGPSVSPSIGPSTSPSQSPIAPSASPSVSPSI